MNVFWQVVITPPPLESGDIHIWHCNLDRPGQESPLNEGILSQDELDRASRFHFPVHRNRFVVGRAHLRNILAGYLQVAPSSITFEYSAFGKPALWPTTNSSKIEFNVSHSEDSWVLAVARYGALGIDVEKIRSDFGGEDIARSNFAPAEFRQLLSIAEEDRAPAFFNCWTRKEAYVKALGAGLQIPLDSFEVTLLLDDPAEFRRGASDDWHLLSFLPEPGYQAAVAYRGSLAKPRFLKLSLS